MTVEVVPAEIVRPRESNPHYPFALEQGNLGVPKRVLYAAFLGAVGLFQQLALSEHQKLLAVTAVILLANPAHDTALNRRKSILEGGSGAGLRAELAVTSSIQSLPDGAKSSLLWHHRRWILRRLYGSVEPHLERCRLPQDVIAAEFALSTRAAQIYPRNYHAWAHRYAMLQAVLRGIQSSEGSSLAELIGLLGEEYRRVESWVERNASDYSAMHYLCRIVEGYQQAKTLDRVSPAASVLHALSLVQAYPTHEALWLYLREACTMARRGDGWTGADEQEVIRAVGELRVTADAALHATRFEAWSKR